MKRPKTPSYNYRAPRTLPLVAAFGILLPAVHAFEVPLASEWTLYDPEGNSSLSGQSSTGFTATITDLNIVDEVELTTNANNRPVVLQEFDPLDLTEVGASIRARFDVTLLTEAMEANDSDFRFAFYDTTTNFEIIVGMLDFGPPGGTGVRMRIDNHISSFDEENPDTPFMTGDYGNFAEGGGTVGIMGVNMPEPGIRYISDISSFEAVVTRISAGQLEIKIDWVVNSEDPTVSASSVYVLNDSIASVDAPDGGFTQLNGFGFRLQDGDPFDQDGDDTTTDSGSYAVSNLVIDRTLIVPLDSSWAEYDPDGAQSITNPTGSGFTATVSDVADPGEGNPSTIPAVYQQFDPLDIS